MGILMPFGNNGGDRMRQQVEELRKENEDLKKTNEDLLQKMAEIEHRVNEMASTNTEQTGQQPDGSEAEVPDDKTIPTEKKSPKQEPLQPEHTTTSDADISGWLERVEGLITSELRKSLSLAKDLETKLKDRNEKYEHLLQNVQEDRYRKDKVKLINKMIFFVDLQRRMLYDFDSHRPEDEATFLRRQIENLIESMDDTLRHEMVGTRPMATQGDDFDEEYMEVIDTVETEDSNLDGKVFRSISACYTWSLPYVQKARIDEKGEEVRTYRFVLHPEEVIIYKLKK